MPDEITFNTYPSMSSSAVTVDIDDTTLLELFEDAWEGYCHVCKERTINESEVVCCECLNLALVYHHGTCGCMEVGRWPNA